MLWLLVVVVALSAIVILIVDGISSTLYVDDPSAAFLAAVGVTVLAWLVAGPIGHLESAIAASLPESPNLGRAAILILAFFTNTVMFSVVALFVPGISIRGGGGLALVGAALMLVDWLVPFLFAIQARIDS